MSVALNSKTVGSFEGLSSVPHYNRSKISPGILHIGIGNFHRAHMGVYMDNLLNMGLGQDWGIVGAGIRSSDEIMRSRLEKQDWLTTVVELDPTELSARVTGAMVDFLPIDSKAIVVGMTDPRIRIVSMTITEGGYYIDVTSGKLDVQHADILFDAAHSDTPKTLFGMIISALRLRKERNIPPFTIISCDNLPSNGQVAKQTVVGLAKLSDESFADWIDKEVSFPDCMVDCITPNTSERERLIVKEKFGIDDAAPVVCEPFHQWVIEDRFPQGRPPLEEVGAEFVSDVSAYELMKLRILNAGHASTCYAAALLGYQFVHDAMADDDIRAWVEALQIRESIPTLQPIENVDYTQYLSTVINRFSNSKIGDTVPRNVANGSDRQPKFIIPTLRDALETGGSIDGLALEIALWCRYCTGVMENGEVIEVKDPIAELLQERAEEAKTRPQAFIEIRAVFGDLMNDVRFAEAFAKQFNTLIHQGTRKALQCYVMQA